MRISDWSSDVCSSDLVGEVFSECAIGAAADARQHDDDPDNAEQTERADRRVRCRNHAEDFIPVAHEECALPALAVPAPDKLDCKDCAKAEITQHNELALRIGDRKSDVWGKRVSERID